MSLGPRTLRVTFASQEDFLREFNENLANGGVFVATEDALYVAHGDRCLVLDPATGELLSVVNGRCLPGLVLASAPPESSMDPLPLLRGKSLVGGRPAAFVCRQYACRNPTGDADELARLLGSGTEP